MSKFQKPTKKRTPKHHGKRVLANGKPKSSNNSTLVGRSLHGQPVACKSGLGGGAAPYFECGQNQPYNHKELPGRFKVSMPFGRIKVRG